MDEMDYETQVAEQLEATKARNIDALSIVEPDGLNRKVKVDSVMTIIGSERMKADLLKKKFRGKLAKPSKEITTPPKETYAERIERLTHEVEEDE